MREPSKDQFVPPGVNAQSWLGFEQRIQERRFRALLETMDNAITQGDAVAARLALEEARELRPNAPELAEMEARTAAIPVVWPPTPGSALWSRTVGAVMLLLVGVSLLIGLEWLREPEAAPIAAPTMATPDMRVASPVPASSSAGEEPAVTIVPPPPVEQLVPQEPVGTTGLEQQIRSAVGRPSLRNASSVDRGSVVPDGEIPDDFVFVPPQALRLPRPAAAPSASARTPAPAATPRPGAGASVNAGSTASPIAPPAFAGDETRVEAVLNQYARAYGRLDASAARAVWPTVDERALARAFDGLASQNVSFDDCAIDVRGTTANASCRGTASYVGKVGSRAPRIEARTWRFELRRDGEAWKIENAEARRQ